ncbi:MAG: aminotransferase class I/II-fold pyridoxal phosphate-dependent enzyme [Bacteroidia bacterium]|jgi:8-amino-7-oxononanoate synthase
MDFLKHKLDEREALQALRKLKPSNMFIDFSSNDYLGLGKTLEQLSGTGKGSGGSRLLYGNSNEAEALEIWLAQAFDSEAALVFNSGYAANLGFCSSVPQKNDVILYDELIHASVRDGIRLSLAKAYSFRHNSIDSLCEKANRQNGRIFVVVESVYSMDGDRAPLEELNARCVKNGWLLVVDEAHALGVYGPNGKGCVAALSDTSGVFARVLTFGKAAGFHGAAVLGSTVLKDYLVNFSRPFIYSTALPPSDYATMHRQLQRLLDADAERGELRNRIKDWKQLIGAAFKTQDCPIQIVPAISNAHADALANQISKEGFDVRAIKHPTVAAGSERLRIILHAFNSEDEIKLLAKCILKVQDFF